ncbi:unnamed protein product [Diplocarpon coronariae]|nr:hypothetical protein JHW43_006055 [Diplocarpon mali]
MQFNIFLAAMVFQFTSTFALTIPAANVERSLHRRATYDVLCRDGVFQNPDMDIPNVVCIAEAKCQGGNLAHEVQDANGATLYQTACYGCPVITSVGSMTNGCMFKDIVYAKC